MFQIIKNRFNSFIGKMDKKETDQGIKNMPKGIRICYYIIFYPLIWIFKKCVTVFGWMLAKAINFTREAIEQTRQEVQQEKLQKQQPEAVAEETVAEQIRES